MSNPVDDNWEDDDFILLDGNGNELFYSGELEAASEMHKIAMATEDPIDWTAVTDKYGWVPRKVYRRGDQKYVGYLCLCSDGQYYHYLPNDKRLSNSGWSLQQIKDLEFVDGCPLVEIWPYNAWREEIEQHDPIGCQCSIDDLMVFGCPSTKGKSCRSFT